MNSVNAKYSIIVPVYNVEKYLRECVESILNQTYGDFELILVDDGSKDNSGRICDSFCDVDCRVKVIHKTNGGLLSAWTSGLEIARGVYVGSIDSDDYIDFDMLAEIEKVVNEDSPDIIVYGYKSINDNHIENHRYSISVNRGLYDKEKIAEVIYPTLINKGCFEGRSSIYLSRVNKFIKADLLRANSHFYLRGIDFGEDNMWTIPNVIQANSIYVMSDYYPYNYRYNPGSITHSVNKNLWDRFVLLDNHIIKMLEELGAKELIKQVYCDSVFHAAISINNVVLDTLGKKEIIKSINIILSDDKVKKGLCYMNPRLCSSKEKLNLKLMKWKASFLIYIIKTLQKKYFKTLFG